MPKQLTKYELCDKLTRKSAVDLQQFTFYFNKVSSVSVGTEFSVVLQEPRPSQTKYNRIWITCLLILHNATDGLCNSFEAFLTLEIH